MGDGNLVYWETCGNADGKPAVMVHGGPARVPRRACSACSTRSGTGPFSSTARLRAEPAARQRPRHRLEHHDRPPVADMERLRITWDRALAGHRRFVGNHVGWCTRAHPDRCRRSCSARSARRGKSQLGWLQAILPRRGMDRPGHRWCYPEIGWPGPARSTVTLGGRRGRSGAAGGQIRARVRGGRRGGSGRARRGRCVRRSWGRVRRGRRRTGRAGAGRPGRR